MKNTGQPDPTWPDPTWLARFAMSSMCIVECEVINKLEIIGVLVRHTAEYVSLKEFSLVLIFFPFYSFLESNVLVANLWDTRENYWLWKKSNNKRKIVITYAMLLTVLNSLKNFRFVALVNGKYQLKKFK